MAEHAELLRRLHSAHDSSTSSHLREHLARALLSLIPAAQQTPAQYEALLLSRGDDAQVAEYFLTSQPESAQRRKLTAYFTQTKLYTPLEPLFSLFEHHDAADVLEQILAVRVNKPRMAGRLSAEDLWLFGRYAATQRREQAFKLAWTGLLDTALPEWERLAQSVSLDWGRLEKSPESLWAAPRPEGTGPSQTAVVAAERRSRSQRGARLRPPSSGPLRSGTGHQSRRWTLSDLAARRAGPATRRGARLPRQSRRHSPGTGNPVGRPAWTRAVSSGSGAAQTPLQPDRGPGGQRSNHRLCSGPQALARSATRTPQSQIALKRLRDKFTVACLQT